MMRRALPVLLAGVQVLAAQPGAETMLFEKIYAKLASSFAAGGALGKEGDFLLMAHPGLALTPGFLSSDYELSQLADQIPLRGLYYQPRPGARVSDCYGTILAHAELSSAVDQARRQKALEARRAIYDRTRPGKFTPAYADYLKFKAAWRTAKDALAAAQTNQLIFGDPIKPGLQQAVDTALAAWEAKGNRKTMDEAEATLKGFYTEDLKSLFTSLVSDFSGSERRDGGPNPWHAVLATPAPGEWLQDTGWQPFKLTHAEKSLAQASAMPLEAQGAKAGPGQVLPDSFVASVSLDLETKRVTFTRPWMDLGLFQSRRWRLQKSTGLTTVSTGNPADPEPGLMPFLVTGVLLSRKLVLHGVFTATRPADLKALGPFSLAGAPAPKAEQNGQMSIAVEGAQIIGFFCTALPKAPDPDDQAFRTP